MGKMYKLVELGQHLIVGLALIVLPIQVLYLWAGIPLLYLLHSSLTGPIGFTYLATRLMFLLGCYWIMFNKQDDRRKFILPIQFGYSIMYGYPSRARLYFPTYLAVALLGTYILTSVSAIPLLYWMTVADYIFLSVFIGYQLLTHGLNLW